MDAITPEILVEEITEEDGYPILYLSSGHKLVIYGDGIGYEENEEVNVLTWDSILGLLGAFTTRLEG